jgi:hypothetical protein
MRCSVGDPAFTQPTGSRRVHTVLWAPGGGRVDLDEPVIHHSLEPFRPQCVGNVALLACTWAGLRG